MANTRPAPPSPACRHARSAAAHRRSRSARHGCRRRPCAAATAALRRWPGQPCRTTRWCRDSAGPDASPVPKRRRRPRQHASRRRAGARSSPCRRARSHRTHAPGAAARHPPRTRLSARPKIPAVRPRSERARRWRCVSPWRESTSSSSRFHRRAAGCSPTGRRGTGAHGGAAGWNAWRSVLSEEVQRQKEGTNSAGSGRSS